MRYHPLFAGGPEVSVIGFGCFPMGGWLWSGVNDDESMAAVRHAFDLGITLFDNADCYGWGHAEELLARALGDNLERAFIATKGGVARDNEGKTFICGKRDYLLRACEASLRRLGVECIDLYQMHWPDRETPPEETMAALVQLRDEGKIRYIGVSNYSGERIEASLKAGPVHTHQPPYNLLNREIESDSLPVCNAHGIGVLAYGPLAEGFLTGKYHRGNIAFPPEDHRNRHAQFTEPNLTRNLRILDRLRPLAAAAGRSLTELAVAWVLAREGYITALCGAKRPAQIEEVARAADWLLAPGDVAAIDAIFAEEDARRREELQAQA